MINNFPITQNKHANKKYLHAAQSVTDFTLATRNSTFRETMNDTNSVLGELNIVWSTAEKFCGHETDS